MSQHPTTPYPPPPPRSFALHTPTHRSFYPFSFTPTTSLQLTSHANPFHTQSVLSLLTPAHPSIVATLLPPLHSSLQPTAYPSPLHTLS